MQSQAWLERIAPQFGGFAGKVVLDVGTDLSGDMIVTLEQRFAAREVVGINLAAENTKLSSTTRLEQGNILETRYSDATFDLIVSSSAFEHITGLERAMDEMHRILKPGGYLYSHFGPIWSTTYGHHLWTTFGDRTFTYWNVTLPPYCHLLMTQPEIENFLIEHHYGQEVARHIAQYVLYSKEQNQLFFEDYARIFSQSKFEILLFKGYDYPYLANRYNAQVTPELLERLKGRYHDKSQFFYDGITTLLRKA